MDAIHVGPEQKLATSMWTNSQRAWEVIYHPNCEFAAYMLCRCMYAVALPTRVIPLFSKLATWGAQAPE